MIFKAACSCILEGYVWYSCTMYVLIVYIMLK